MKGASPYFRFPTTCISNFLMSTGEFSMQSQEKWQKQGKSTEPVIPPPEPAAPSPEPSAPPSEPTTPSVEPVISREPGNPPTEPLPQAKQPDSVSVPLEPSFEEKIANAEARVAEMQDAFLRAKAEAENMRRRAQEDILRAHKFAIEGFAEALVPVKDSLETALKIEAASIESFKEGLEMTLKQLNSAFEKNRLTEINPMPGDKLDPLKHQAISMEPAEQKANIIINVLQKGYMIADRLLRPALVTVAQQKRSNSGA
jgi:molecular chaperone GrpE